MTDNIVEIDENDKIILSLKKKIEHLEIYNESLRNTLEKKRSQEKLYYQFFNMMPFSTLLIDVDTFVIIDCNDEFVKSYNISREDLFLNYTPSDFLPDLSIHNLTKKHKSYHLPYVHHIDNKHYFVDIDINSFDLELSNYLILTIIINKIEE